MDIHTFMIPTTLHVRNNIHGWPNITWMR